MSFQDESQQLVVPEIHHHHYPVRRVETGPSVVDVYQALPDGAKTAVKIGAGVAVGALVLGWLFRRD